MKVKELQKTVNIAWSPQPQNPIYLAAGTAAQQLDSNATSTLEIYSTNFKDPSYDLELKATLPSQFRFQKLIWSPTGFESSHANGLIVGGCEGGHILIYSAAKMLENENALVARQDKHTGPVSGLAVNPFQTNLLASCASESEIFIWDLNNTTTHMNPGAKTQPLEDVQNVAWNRQVQHILASVFSSRCVIWDLRKSEQIIKLSDTQSRVRWHAIQWHPDVATQVWLASEDDQAPVVQLWDLRYATAPAKTMQIHQRGVLGMSWCPQDTDLMVSCGKDNRIYCWNPNTEIPEGEILSEVATTATWYSDVQWCPRNPALIASSSLDGCVSVYSLFGGTQQQVQTTNKIADSFPGMDQFAQVPVSQQSAQIVYHDLKRAPKWIKRPSGVAFGFGGKLLHFNNKGTTVNVSQVITEPELVERAQLLEQSWKENVVEYCRYRADKTTDQKDRYLWYFIKANFDINPREEMLNLLGFNKDDIDNKFSKYTNLSSPNTSIEQEVGNLANRVASLGGQNSDSLEIENEPSSITDATGLSTESNDNNAIFDSIANHQAQKTQLNGELDDSQQSQKSTKSIAAAPSFKIPSGEHPDTLITEALLSGNLEAAVELCMEAKRVPEALIIASTTSIDFLTDVQTRILQQKQQEHSELSNVIMALVTRDWLDFVTRCNLDSWKEALVAALRHSERKAVDICERLGDRLMKERSNNIDDVYNALLCYLCATNIDKFVDAWHHLKSLKKGRSDQHKLDTSETQELAEFVMLMTKSLDQQGVVVEMNGRCVEFVKEYCDLLASQGALTSVLDYLYALGTHESSTLEALRERVFNTINYKRPTQTLYERQVRQPSRGSFSHQFPAAVYPGGATMMNPTHPTTKPVPAWNAAPMPPVANAMPTNIFNPVSQAAAIPTQPPPMSHEPPTMSQPLRPSSRSSSQGNPSNAAAAAGTGTGQSSGGGGLQSRPKYVLDPSVAAPGGVGSYGITATPFNSAPMQPMSTPGMPIPGTAAPVQTFNPTSFNTNALTSGMGMQQDVGGYNSPSMMSMPYGGGSTSQSYMPGVPPIETGVQAGLGGSSSSVPPPPSAMQSIQRNPTPPPGWNDPPALKSTSANWHYNRNNCDIMSPRHAGTRKWQQVINHKNRRDLSMQATTTQATVITTVAAPTTLMSSLIANTANNVNSPSQEMPCQRQRKKSESSSAAPPITHPLFGVDPNQNQNGYLDPTAYQQSGMMAPPPLPGSAQTGYLNPSMNNNNMAPPPPSGGNMQQQQHQQQQQQPQQFTQQMNFQTSAYANPMQQQQQGNWNTQASSVGYAEQPAPVQQQSRQPPPPKEKPPLPEEYIYMQTVLDELKNQCLEAATDPRTKRKFVEVAKRLETLYDCLRDGRLTTQTITSLNQMIQLIQIGDYANALAVHTQIAFGSDFSQCAGFMPGLKALMQSANELQVYLR